MFKQLLRQLAARLLITALSFLLTVSQFVNLAIQGLFFTLKLFFPQSVRLQKLYERAKPNIDNDIFNSAEDIVAQYPEYKLEIHTTTTQDGYVLTAWRLRKRNCATTYPYPVLLMHGLLDCSFSWFVLKTPAQKCLPYLLADLGADVWVLNNRGNRYSLAHETLNTESKKYWDFAFDELAKYDVPAHILNVKRVTQCAQVVYIGHSQGTSQFFAQACLAPEFIQEHVHLFIGLGPAIFVSNLKSEFVKGVFRSRFFDILSWLQVPHFLLVDAKLSQTVALLCYHLPSFFQDAILHLMNLLVGFPENNRLPKERVPLIARHEPGGTSLKNLLQWIQFYKSNEFAQYDYGKAENLRRYQQESAPIYQLENLKNLQLEKHLFIGTQDIVGNIEDTQRLYELFESRSTHLHVLDDYAHLCYVWGTDAHTVLYPQILEILENHRR